MMTISILRKPKRPGLIKRLARVNHLLVSAGLMACAILAMPASAQCGDAPDETFAEWRADFIDRAVEKGHDRQLVTTMFAGISPIERTIELDCNQPEFVRPIWDYLDSAVSSSRQETGVARLDDEADLLDAIEEEYEVDAEALVAMWGLESAFGAVIGNTDVVAALATLAWDGRRRDLFEGELYAVIEILEAGHATRGELIGGWAGAMGQTQFMPTTYVSYAVDHDGDGHKDLWTNRGDALASAANYLRRFNWTPDQRWGVEVILPEGFNYGLADGRKSAVRTWVSMGIVRADENAFGADMRDIEAKLLLPAGASGPAFLTFPNFDVIKRYNNSTAYALGVGLLSDAIADRPGVVREWPRHTQLLDTEAVETMQRTLRALGYNPRGVDGRVGPNTQKALREWQTANGLPADAFATRALLDYMLAQL